MSERHPHVRCMSVWCKYWIRIFDESHGEHVGGCGAWDLLISTKSGDDTPTCAGYKVSDDPQRAGIHASENIEPFIGLIPNYHSSEEIEE